MKISEVMTRSVETVAPNQTAKDAAQFMLRAEAGSIPVCENEKLVGMVTDRDIAVRGVAEGRGPDATIRDLMSTNVVCAHEDEDVGMVARRMSQEQVRRMPVLDANDRMVGIVSLGDLARETRGDFAEQALEGIAEPGGRHQQ
jgi:CBS domain-containing protein